MTLKIFSQKRGIRQSDLNVVFRRYLSHPEVYLREFRVRTFDTKNAFLNKSRLMQEIADVVVPSIFFKDFKGLEEPHSVEEISFARFAITSYLFCAQPIQDLIYDFLAILRQKLTLKITAVMFTYNFSEILQVLRDECLDSSAAKIALRSSNPGIAVNADCKCVVFNVLCRHLVICIYI